MKTQPAKHGGFRHGSGRKPTGKRSLIKSISMPAHEWALFEKQRKTESRGKFLARVISHLNWARVTLDKVAAEEMKTFRPSSDETGTAGGHNHDAEPASTLTGVAAGKATVSGKPKTSSKP